MNRKLRILGLMSGTSLDGLDLCLAEFEGDRFEILAAETVPYDDFWRHALSTAEHLSGLELIRLDRAYGRHLGEEAARFLEQHQLKANAVASHGHTIFHQPAAGFTLQIGHGASLAAAADLPVINDFRSLDVALGGQGAPLVPIGDLHLFQDYKACLNLGGFANISIKDDKGGIIAFDVSACNIVLNHLAQKLGHPYDAGGAIAKSGQINTNLLDRLNNLQFFRQIGPKSLGKEWMVDTLLPIIDREPSPPDAMRTFTEHAAFQIAKVCRDFSVTSVLTTGGGAHNDFFIQRLQDLLGETRLILPDRQVVDFKEGLIFAYLGYRFLEVQPNAFRSVTGASRDSIGGCLYNPS